MDSFSFLKEDPSSHRQEHILLELRKKTICPYPLPGEWSVARSWMTSGLAKCQAMLREVGVLVLENCRMDAEIHYCARRGRGRRRELVRATLQPRRLPRTSSPGSALGGQGEDPHRRAVAPLLPAALPRRAS
ncbi:uncharacterized protein LOC126949274 isoform X2 [Macaca thibetana thibetana]|uniref:uncharacterized protein LOC126949274 isoform X2 n=1 Tax=Macaca thibetana thibetana TaxID=257877 RepID=UPI0021BCE852|nr:uncharacterized protein LOC126949274 isoform X2 [Macaca thibetana thibetana]